ncbi:bacteriophytochrome (light-regulated signal transduction histidine kinase) [Rivularia sp. PCC 7116]|uniref:GAF domain-containing protein n=1 Tax=Rivularia sp. PCC 7116 TaxID=373994 RepID=UPI00029F39B4|nr:GAF domain-containing protein [Rivularia sp. PCC 7116]AFY52619.1 bacteriophytochrome (light-regulated signal transduction histidine kinase) [Rivularia sp. PCC 7116]
MTLPQEKSFPKNIEPDNLIYRITNCIRCSSELKQTFTRIVAEVRLFLATDRVMIYKFHPDASGKVVAESINNDILPSLLGLNFPADDIPAHARELFIKSRVRSIVDVETGQIGKIPVCEKETGEIISEDISCRSVDKCHLKYLTAMGVKSSVAIPIFHQEQLWGLLVAHHSETYSVSEQQLTAMQMVVNQLSVAITHNTLLTQASEQAKREAIVSCIATLLHSSKDMPLQAALEKTVAAFKGCGGRLCIRNQTSKSLNECLESDSDLIQIYTNGQQPTIPDSAQYSLMEQSSVWGEYYKCGNYDVWAISDIHQISGLRNLQPAFQINKIRSILMIPLEYHQQLLGYLSIFREEIDTETLWAGQFDSDERQNYPRKSFEAWRESKTAQAHQWAKGEIELAEKLAKQFATAIHQHDLHQQLQAFNTNLETQVKQRTEALQQSAKQRKILFAVVTKIRESLDLEVIFKTTTQQVCQSLQADRVAVYRFNHDWSGEFVAEFVNEGWVKLVNSDATKIWKDTYLEETQGGSYRFNKSTVVNDIYEAGYADCHIELLEQFQAKAYAVAPIFRGEKLWGLLAAYQNSAPRHWKVSEIKFLCQTAIQFGIAIQQSELLTQTKQQAISLKKATEQQQLLFNLVAKMRKSLELDTIFQITTKELRRILNTDRVGVYRFDSDSEYNYGELIAEEISAGISSALAVKIKDSCFGENYVTKYRHGRVSVVTDVRNAGLKDCHVAILEKFQVKANIIAPVMKGEELWGLLCIHQCDKPRNWKTSEVQFVTQVGIQLSIALEQADLLAQSRLQTEEIKTTLVNLRKAQTQLIQSEKMSSLGQLVAGIAHEINNPVNFIYGNINHIHQYAEDLLSILELYQQSCNGNNCEVDERAEEIDLEFLVDDLPRMLSSMKIGAKRIREIVLSLRNFSRLDEADLKSADIHQGIESTLLILQYRLKAKLDSPGIKVIKEYGELPEVECYAGQLNQVLMNVFSNAIDTLEEGVSHSFWEVEADNNQSLTPRIRICTHISEDKNRIVIRIADNGLGITEEVMKRMFDPFFTTKPIGKGTGLGLSISYQIIVDKHDGIFNCKSLAGKGTEFSIEIPLRQSK